MLVIPCTFPPILSLPFPADNTPPCDLHFCEIKENVQGTKNEGKETRTQISGLDQKEEINIHPEQNEETRIQKNKERLWNLWDNFKRSNIRIIGVPEGEEEE